MDDLIGEFITETSESLAVLDSELVKLEQNPNDAEILGNIFRLVHTIKGTCGFLGLPRLETVAHAGENVLGKIRDNEIEVTPAIISIILEALDHIKMLLDYLSEHGEEPAGSDEDLTRRLNAFADGTTDILAEIPAPAVVEQAPAKGDPLLANLPSNEGGLSKDVLDELERAFRDTTSTVEGGQAAIVPALPVATQANAASEPPKPIDLEKLAQDKAIKEGLAVDAGKDGTGSLANQSIRVNLNVLENLMQMVGELVLTRNQIMQVVRNRDDNELKAPLQHLSHITTELQEAVMKTRMQPIGNAWAKFPRLIRDLSIELNKKIELRMEGSDTELDRQLLEMIKDPLTHMVRNSCDHGLEGPAERLKAGKPETGTVTLSAYHEGGHIIIELADDGRGLNLERVKQKAIENGLTTADEVAGMSEDQIAQFIFRPGFSTAEKVTSVSGRGVGMDVVRTNIEKIGGTVELSSVTGKGSTFHIKIPLTLAIVSVLIVETSHQRFALPQINVLELVQAGESSDHRIEIINKAQVLRLRDKLLPLVQLHEVLNLPAAVYQQEDGTPVEEEYIVVCRVGGTDFGVIVDRIFDTEEIVVKPVSELLKSISVFSGNTILGDGSVIMILDPNGLARTISGQDGTKLKQAEIAASRTTAQSLVSFLLFKSGDGAPKAVPLELISRLEEIDVARIERSGHMPVVQYRDDLMRLKTLSEGHIPADGKADVVVFTYDGQAIGLVVDEILDIVEAPLQIKLGSTQSDYLGSLVIAGKTTDVVDVGHMLSDMVDHGALREMTSKSGQIRVCFVDDSIFFRKLMVPFLNNAGFHVMDFTMASEALLYLRQDPQAVDVVISDIEMPEMDGFAFAEAIHQNPDLAHLPVIAFTSTVNETVRLQSEKAAMRSLILKTNREALVKAITEAAKTLTKRELV